MNKRELIAEISKETNLSRANAKLALESITETIKRVVADGEDVRLSGFGRFYSKHVDERMSKNPKTQDVVITESHRKIKFDPSAVFKDSVWEVKKDE